MPMVTSQILKSVDFTKAQKSRYLENEIFFLQIKKIGITKPCTHLHPAHFNLQPAHFNLHPTHLSLHPPLCNTLNVIRTKISHVIGNFPKYWPKNSKLSIFTENWHTWSLGGADSKSALKFLIFHVGYVLLKSSCFELSGDGNTVFFELKS